MDNLLLELFLELLRIHGYPVDHGLLERFHSLVGNYHSGKLPPEEDLEDPETHHSMDYLDEILTDMIGDDDEAAASRVRGEGTAERRVFRRLPEARVVRYSPPSAPAMKLARMGNVSEGGIFIRTGDVLSPGTLAQLDMTLPAGGTEHQLTCKGQVVWVSPDGEGSECGPGIGLKFMLPTDQAGEVIRRILKSRIGEG